jgi:hypothetical protein
MKEKPDRNKSIIVLPNAADLDREKRQFPYGREWRENCKTVIELRNTLESEKLFSKREDWELADSVNKLLEQRVMDDRLALIASDLDKIAVRAEKEGWGSNQAETEIALLRMSYLAQEEDFNRIVNTWKLSKMHMTSIPQPSLRKWNENELHCVLYKFTDISIEKKNRGFHLALKPLYDGGISSVSYPVKEVNIDLQENKPLSLNVFFMFWRINELDDEIKNHSEIVSNVKGLLKENVDFYRTDREGYVDERQSDGDHKDKTQALGSLYTFMNKYLSRKLKPEVHRQFQKIRDYIYSDNISAALNIRVLVEQLLNEDSYINQGYYKEKYPSEVERVKEKTWKAVENIGGIVEGGVITNFSEIVQRAAGDPKFAREVNNAYITVFKTEGDKIVLRMMKDEVDNWRSIYGFDLDTRAYTVALKKARGLKTDNGILLA